MDMLVEPSFLSSFVLPSEACSRVDASKRYGTGSAVSAVERGFQVSLEVLLDGIEAAMALTLIYLK